MAHARIAIPEFALRDFCERNRIHKLALFGSVLRDDFSPSSDVDVLVEFEPGTRVGLFGLAEIEHELSELLGRKADLNTTTSLSRHFRDRVIAEAEAVYVAA